MYVSAGIGPLCGANTRKCLIWMIQQSGECVGFHPGGSALNCISLDSPIIKDKSLVKMCLELKGSPPECSMQSHTVTMRTQLAPIRMNLNT